MLSNASQQEVGGGHEIDNSAVEYNAMFWTQDPSREWANLWMLFDKDNNPVGFLGASIFQHFYNWTKGARQEEWYVLPQHRSILTARLLVDAYEKWAMEWGCSRIFMGIEYIQQTDLDKRVGKLIESFGYTRRGTYYTKETAS